MRHKESRRNEAARQVGLTSRCRRENKEEPPFLFTLQTPSDRVSLWAQGQTPHCAASNPVAGQAPEETYLNCSISSPAAEAQQLQCSDAQVVLRDVAHPKSGQEKPGPGHFAFKRLVTMSLFTAYATVISLCSAMRGRQSFSISFGEIMCVVFIYPQTPSDETTHSCPLDSLQFPRASNLKEALLWILAIPERCALQD